ncbi:mesothelin [Castor canadensis]|uniref:Mesothelin n=1 Tax=Castor canadensis TaxID=51338 RepID=A0A8B7VMV1_CASCN|nr:mesothelin [Castor canadensis]
MALLTARCPLEPCRTPTHGHLLLLVLTLGWVQPLRAAETGEDTVQLDRVLPGTGDFASLAPDLLLSFSCAEVSGLSTERVRELAIAVGQKNVTLQVDQLRCLAHRLSEHLAPEDLDAIPVDVLPFLNPAAFLGPQACTSFLSRVSKVNIHVLPRKSPERQRLLLAALSCRGVRGSRVSQADVQALGNLACDLPGSFVADSAEALLPWLAGCPEPLDQDQEEAARMALQGGGRPYGPPSRWSASSLNALQGLLAVLDQPIIHSIPKSVTAVWLQRVSRSPSWRGSELPALLPRFRRGTEKRACPPERKPQVVDEKLFFYEEWELKACVDGALLAAQIDRVNRVPFTYQQLSIFKHKLDEFYPQGYPESLIQRLSYFFRYLTLEDIQKWNVTSLETVKNLLKVAERKQMDAQAAALVARYLLGKGQLDKDTLDTLANIRPTYLCILSPEQLDSVPPRVLWTVEPQDLDSCSQRQLDILYPYARLAFQNISGLEYFGKIKAFLGGAPKEDLQAFSGQNVSMDMATFKKLPLETLVQLTVDEVQKLLGPHVVGLQAEENNSPVRDWIFRQPQEDLDRLGLGLHGGTPNGYLVLDLNFREAFSRGAPLKRGLVLALIPALLLVLTLS